MNQRINNAMMRFTKRAEAVERAKLVETFVDTGALVSLLNSFDHQIIFGRRGTGKTHALLYLSESVVSRGDISVYIDMRTIGSSGGLYSDASLPISERATRLLSDTLGTIHEELLNTALTRDDADLGRLGPLLDFLAEAITEVKVFGPVSQETTEEIAGRTDESAGIDVSVKTTGPDIRMALASKLEVSEVERSRITVSGERRHRIHFGSVGSILGRISDILSPKRLWILIDEWSVVPIELQPYLADLIRRSTLPVPRLTVKIGAIEQRSHFAIAGYRGDYIGIELGADVSADLNLDDYMVFDNNAARATQYFSNLLYKHYKSVEKESGITSGPVSPEHFIQVAFTQRTSFDELVRAAEGVPRDAINILGLSAQRAGNESITINHIRTAAKTWYQRDKEAAVSANLKAKSLLYWIIEQVIAHRRARAFLLRSGEHHQLIDALFDSRVLHLLKRGIAAHDQPGIRFDVFKIDYGCYVDLLTTARAPLGLFLLDEPEESTSHIDVPPDDYRAIRRAILDIKLFEEKTR